MNQTRPRSTEVRNEFPLLLKFDMKHPINREHDKPGVIAGFRDWAHWQAFVKQMFERNAIVVRNPIELTEEFESVRQVVIDENVSNS